MNDKFQQVYDYLNSVGSLAEGSTAESFNEKYTSGSGNINRLYSQVASDPDFPIEFSSIEQFQTDVFGGLKKKQKPNSLLWGLLRKRLSWSLPQVRLRINRQRVEIRIGKQ